MPVVRRWAHSWELHQVARRVYEDAKESGNLVVAVCAAAVLSHLEDDARTPAGLPSGVVMLLAGVSKGLAPRNAVQRAEELTIHESPGTPDPMNSTSGSRITGHESSKAPLPSLVRCRQKCQRQMSTI